MSLDYPHRVFRRLKNGVVITGYYYAQDNKDYYAKKDGEQVGLWHTEEHSNRRGMNYSYGEIKVPNMNNRVYDNFKEWLLTLEREVS